MAIATSPVELSDPLNLVSSGRLYEVVDGQVLEVPHLGAHEGWLASLLLAAIAGWDDQRRRGNAVAEILFVLDHAKKLRRRPDLAFVSDARWPARRRVPREEAWDVVPNLAVEIVSPSNNADDLMAKIDEYFLAGVRLVWIVFPEQRRIYAYETPKNVLVFGDGDTLDGGTVLPGFELVVSDWFGEEDEEAKPEQPGT